MPSDRERAEALDRAWFEIHDWSLTDSDIDALAAEYAAVRADERERCAKVVKREGDMLTGTNAAGLIDFWSKVADAIRAMKEEPCE